MKALSEKYEAQDVQVLIIDVKEDPATVRRWADRWNFEFPILLDRDGSVAAEYAVPDIRPELPRDETVIAANLLIDREGKIRFYSLLDTTSFDAKLIKLTERLEEILSED